MKCPKCHYLGFETGDRCKNCGYDFSLAAFDLDLKTPESAPAARADLPLFAPADADDDAPLVKLPAAPRRPLAVRRTPDAPRPRSVPKPSRSPQPELALQFLEEHPATRTTPPAQPEPERPPIAIARAKGNPPPVVLDASGAGRRLGAALIDHALLLAIDGSVIYFTLRMAALTPADWTLLPPAPLLAFLGLLKLGYFSTFTAVGGQTIGKMAAGIRVVTNDNRSLDPTSAVRRTLAGFVSYLTLGIGFLPALFSADRRALHDRLAHTRVVTLPS